MVAFGVLIVLVVPDRYRVESEAFGLGLDATAYTLGMWHAFDADHIGAMDNTARKLMADGKHPVSVGFWFALGHFSVVVARAALAAGCARLAGTLINDDSGTHRMLGVIGESVSGTFLYVIAALNLVALLGSWASSQRRGPLPTTRPRAGRCSARQARPDRRGHRSGGAGPDLDSVGYVIVGLFVVVWAAALSYWRLAKVEERWSVRAAGGS